MDTSDKTTKSKSFANDCPNHVILVLSLFINTPDKLNTFQEPLIERKVASSKRVVLLPYFIILIVGCLFLEGTPYLYDAIVIYSKARSIG